MIIDFKRLASGVWDMIVSPEEEEPQKEEPRELEPLEFEIVPLGKEPTYKETWTQYESPVAGIESYVVPKDMQAPELDPPSKSFLQKLLFDWLQRLNFAQAGVWRTQLEEMKTPEMQAQLENTGLRIQAAYPSIDKQIADQWATEMVFAETGKPGPFPASAAALMDLILKKDTDRAAALWSGLTGADKSMFMDIAGEEGVPRMLGLILDMGLDPINYLPWGMMLKGAGKGLMKAPGMKRAIGAIKDTSLVDALGKMFVPGWKLPKKYHLFESFFRRRGYADQADVIADTIKMSNKVQGNKQSIAKLMTYVKQHPGSLNKLSTHNQEIFLQMADEIDELGKKLVISKYMPFTSYKKWKDTYMYGFYPNYTRMLSSRLPPTKFQLVAKASFSRPKMFATVDDAKQFVKGLDIIKDAKTVDEALDMAKIFRETPDQISNIEKAMKALNDIDDIQSYRMALQASYTPEENFFKLSALYKTEAGNLFRRDAFIKGVLDEFAQKVPNVFDPGTVPAGKKLFFPKGRLRFYPGGDRTLDLIDDFLGSLSPGDEMVELTPKVREVLMKIAKSSADQVGVTKRVPAYLIDENIAARLNKTTSFFWGDPSTSVMLKHMNKWYMAWKGMATAMRLPFHLRNAYSNMFLMYVMDVDPHMIPVRMVQAADVRLAGVGVVKWPTLRTVAGKDISAQQIFQTAKEMQVIKGTAWMRGQRSVYEQLKYFNKYGRLKAGTNPMEWGRKAGEAIEDNARLALYIDRVAKGDDFRTAALKVFEGLYDYSPIGLTDFETNVMKRAMPFYTWARKNTPHMIHTLLSKPQKLSNLGKVERMLYDAAPETREERFFKPEYFDTNMWLKAPEWVPQMVGQKGPLYYHLDLPVGELSGDQNQVVNLLNPMGLKPVIEFITGRKTFPKFGMKVETFPKQKVPAPGWMAYIPGDIQKLLGMGPMIDQRSGKRVLGIRARNLQLIYSMLPVLAEGSKLFPAQVDIEQERAPWRAATYATGIGFMPLDINMQKQYWEIQRRGMMGELQRFLMQGGRAPTREEIDEILKGGR